MEPAAVQLLQELVGQILQTLGLVATLIVPDSVGLFG